jgi:hypothetical protein
MNDLYGSGPVTELDKRIAEEKRLDPRLEHDTEGALKRVRAKYPHLDLENAHRREVLAAVEAHAATRGGAGAQPISSAVVQFENAVLEAQKWNQKLDTAAAMQLVAREQPDLARARNIALSQPVVTSAITLSDL